MPPIFVHFFLGLGAAALVGWWVRKYAPSSPLRAPLAFLAFGLVWGSVGPDADLLASSAATVAAGFDTEPGKFWHRTMTHGVPFVAALLVAGTFLWTRGQGRLGPFLVGFGTATAALHILPDVWYLVPAKIWAPFSFEEVGPFGWFVKERFTDAENNVINGLDFLGDSLAYLAVFALARSWGTANRFTERWLPILALVNAAIFVPLTVLVAPRVSYDAFLIWSYVPGIVFITITTLVLPWKARETFLAVGGAARGG